jgi:superfamily II DNA/RNA helicase
MQFTTPTPIQSLAIPLILQGKDILGSAQTGTGKTGAFGIPLIARLMSEHNSTALILAPTRELAAQIVDNLVQMIPVPNLKTALLIGGESMPKQFRQLQHNPRIIIGTPGRVNDHLERGSLKLNKTHFLVLDETDRMLDMGFGVQLERIVQYLPKERQTLMFSATLPSPIIKLSAKYLKNPERISAGSTTNPATKIKQENRKVAESDKYQTLTDELKARKGSVIVFVKTKYGTEKLAQRLSRAEFAADAIHGDLQQKKRDRVIAAFRDQKFRILVATDVAARGLDIPHIEHVINYDLPQCPEDYIHRIGRTARAGAEGEALNIITSADFAKWRAIERLINPESKSNDSQGRNHDTPRPDRNFKPRRKNSWAKRKSAGGGERDYSRSRSEGGSNSASLQRTSERPTFAKKFDSRKTQDGRKFYDARR